MTADELRARAPLEPALDFLQHLWRLNHALERRSLQMERTLGLTTQQRLLLRCIGKYPGITAGQLAEFLHLDPGTVSAGLRRLQAKRMLTRRRDRRDQRRVVLGLTPRGQALERPDPATVEYTVQRLIAQVGLADVETAKGVLLQLSEALAAALEA
jgi:MarR family transcriptional regulator, organic hydroperoxide resistance regulator